MLTEQSIKILKANGWSENRSIDIDEYRRKLKEKEFKWNKYCEEFIKKYGGLHIKFKRENASKIFENLTKEEIKDIEKKELHFDILELMKNDYGVDLLREIIEENNKNFIPIGEASNGYCYLFMDEIGKIYIFNEEILGVYDSIEDFMNKHFNFYFAEVIE